MPDYVPIQDLTIVGSIGNNDLFPLSDGSGAYAVRGSTIKSYAASDAAAAAADAALSKTAAQNAATAAGQAQSAVEGAAADAQAAAADAADAVAEVQRFEALARNGYSKISANDNDWELGSYNYPNGNLWESTQSIRTTDYINLDAGVVGVTCESGYRFLVFAWDKNGSYVGALQDNGTFAKTGYTRVTEYYLEAYPEYNYKIAMHRTDSADMTVDESSNCQYVMARYSLEMEKVIPRSMLTYQPTQAGMIVYFDGAVGNPSSLVHTDYIDLTGISEIVYTRIYTTTASASWGMAFYDSEKVYISGQQGSLNNDVYHYEYDHLAVPEGAVYARFSWYAPLGDFELFDARDFDATMTGDVDSLKKDVTALQAQQGALVTLGLHTAPENIGQLNIVKRCRQMTDIKWTPAVDLPRLMLVQRSINTTDAQEYEGVFKAGTEYTGIPYGRANDMGDYGYVYGFVGLDIDFGTFVTAVENADSLVCKESEFVLADHETTKYAAVCSALTCYALNVPYYQTSLIPTIPGLTSIGKINNNGTLLDDSNFKLGDVLNLQGYHTAIVTDIIRDAEGVLTAIELSDASTAGLADKNYADGQLGGLCRRKGWTRDQLYAAGSWGDYTLWRYAYADSVPYTPSSYVNVGDELDMMRQDHYPCMPYCGNGFVYKVGSIPNTDILIAPDLGYDKLRVFKDNVEITGSPFTVTSETTKVATGFSAAGSYKAYLCTMQNGEDKYTSYACKWTVED